MIFMFLNVINVRDVMKCVCYVLCLCLCMCMYMCVRVYVYVYDCMYICIYEQNDQSTTMKLNNCV